MSAEDQVGGEILVVGVRLDEFVARDRREDELSRNEAAGGARVDVVAPEEAPAADAILDESDWILRNSALGVQAALRETSRCIRRTPAMSCGAKRRQLHSHVELNPPSADSRGHVRKGLPLLSRE